MLFSKSFSPLKLSDLNKEVIQFIQDFVKVNTQSKEFILDITNKFLKVTQIIQM